MERENDTEKGSGDLGEDVKPEETTEPQIQVTPDVELLVDGFGFMPKSMHSTRSRISNVFEKSHKSVKEMSSPAFDEVPKSPCASSTNIDIVRRYTWKTKNRMIVQVITYGATITSIQVPDRKGVPDDVVAGFDTLEEYFNPRNPYFGATIGRYANIIREGTMVVRPSGRIYMLSTNKGHHHYNGGYVGFDKVNWRSYIIGNQVIMSHVSDRFHEGYPGTVMAQVTFEVTCDNTIKIEMKCTTSEPTIVNLSSAPYFNLGGHHTGCETLYDHIFTINADKYTVTDDEGIVTGDRKVVGGTPFDFRVPRILRTMLPKIPLGGYDLNFCITQGTAQDLTFQARVLHPTSGRVLELYSNQPGMQFYTGNLLPDPDRIIETPATREEHEEEESVESQSESEESGSGENGEEANDEASEGKVGYGYVPLMGKQGTYYKKHGLFCLMPQNYPDAVNHWQQIKYFSRYCPCVGEPCPNICIGGLKSARNLLAPIFEDRHFNELLLSDSGSVLTKLVGLHQSLCCMKPEQLFCCEVPSHLREYAQFLASYSECVYTFVQGGLMVNFPNSILNPGEVYVHRIQYKFGILLGKYV